MGGSVGGVKKKNHKKSENGRPETPEILSWRLKTTRHGHQIDKKLNMAENLMLNFIKKGPKRVKSKEDTPPNVLYLEMML